MSKKVKNIKDTIVEGDEKVKLLRFPCKCSFRVVRGDLSSWNWCEEHWKEFNEMEAPDAG